MMIRLSALLCLLFIPAAAAGQGSPAPAVDRASWSLGAVLQAPGAAHISHVRFDVPPPIFNLSALRQEQSPSPGRATPPLLGPEQRADRPFRFDVPPPIFDASAFRQERTAASQRPVAVEYSRGYEIRQRIHVLTSLATLPLFGAEVVLGQKLYDGDGGGGVRNAHSAVAGGIAAAFGINTVTGAWNLWEGRKNPAGRARRVTHALMMLAADAGFVATASLAPESEDGEISGNRGRHRTVALTSIGLAATSYIIMLIGR
jgi:hypothetical protein